MQSRLSGGSDGPLPAQDAIGPLYDPDRTSWQCAVDGCLVAPSALVLRHVAICRRRELQSIEGIPTHAHLHPPDPADNAWLDRRAPQATPGDVEGAAVARDLSRLRH